MESELCSLAERGVGDDVRGKQAPRQGGRAPVRGRAGEQQQQQPAEERAGGGGARARRALGGRGRAVAALRGLWQGCGRAPGAVSGLWQRSGAVAALGCRWHLAHVRGERGRCAGPARRVGARGEARRGEVWAGAERGPAAAVYAPRHGGTHR